MGCFSLFRTSSLSASVLGVHRYYAVSTAKELKFEMVVISFMTTPKTKGIQTNHTLSIQNNGLKYYYDLRIRTCVNDLQQV